MKCITFILFLALAACSSQPKGQDPLLDSWEKNVSSMFGTAEVTFTPALQEPFAGGQPFFSTDAKDFLLSPTTRIVYYTLEKVISESSASYKIGNGSHIYTNITFTIKNGAMEAKLYSKENDAPGSPITNATHTVTKK